MKPRSFTRNPSALYIRAVHVLKELLDQESLDSVQRAYAQAVWEAVIKKYAEAGNLKLSTLPGDVLSLKREHAVLTDSIVRLPGQDHASLWLKEDKPYRFISQPYVMDLHNMKRLVEFCEVNDLWFEINAFQSWHFPGSSLMVELKKRVE